MRSVRNTTLKIDAREISKALARLRAMGVAVPLSDGHRQDRAIIGRNVSSFEVERSAIVRLEKKFEAARSETERKRIISALLEHFAQACARASVTTKILSSLLGMKKMRRRGAPRHAKKKLTVKSRALLASAAMQKAGHAVPKADKWAWDELPPRDRDLFNPKELGGRKPTWKTIDGWRHKQAREAKAPGKDHETAQAWLEIGTAVRNLKKRSTPPLSERTWKETAEKIIIGEIVLWPLPSPPKVPSQFKLPMSGRLVSPSRFSSASPVSELDRVRSRS